MLGKNANRAISLYNIAILHFTYYSLRSERDAHYTLLFPPGKGANILREALGVIFRRFAYIPDCYPYARVFEPVASGDGPSGLVDWPRPFVFRARHLDGCTVGVGETFRFDLRVFTAKSDLLAYFILTFATLAREESIPQIPNGTRRKFRRNPTNGRTKA